MTDPVIAGVDGSSESIAAAEQAAAAAVRRSAHLVLVHGYLHPFGYGVPIDPYAIALPEPTDAAVRMLDDLARTLQQKWPELDVETQQVAGGPGAALVELSQQAQLTVVGSRGHGGFTGLLLGSVSSQVAAHARSPVMVVRPPHQPPPRTGPVVVGVDGSPQSQLALAFAADEAAGRGSQLVILHVWSVDTRGSDATYATAETAARTEAETLLAEAAADVRRRQPDLAVEERSVQSTDPKQVLLAASREAMLVVVGSRGRGGFTGMLLGSVSQALVQHGHCPIVIAHARGHRAPS